MFAFRSKLKPGARVALLLTALLGVSACQTTYRNHGFVPSAEELAGIEVGVDTRDSVAEEIGAPGSSGVLKDSGYYYVATRMKYYGPRKPKTVSRDLVAISFTNTGVVSNIERFGLQDGQVIAFERRVTSSSVEDKTFLRQLLGNVGRISPDQLLQ